MVIIRSRLAAETIGKSLSERFKEIPDVMISREQALAAALAVVAEHVERAEHQFLIVRSAGGEFNAMNGHIVIPTFD